MNWAPQERAAPRGSDGLGLARRKWRDGWDPSERCPRDPKGDSSPGGQGWRAGAVVAGRDWWVLANDARRRTVRLLRRAGYHVRRRWAREGSGFRQHGRAIVPSWTYSEGPAEGLEAVDPWVRAMQLQSCSSTWSALPRVAADGGMRLLGVPNPCGQHHVCPVCAARKSRALAREVRAWVEAEGQQHGPGAGTSELALVTLTQTAVRGESLHDALERWRRAWRLMVRGRRGRRLRRHVSGWYYGIECTRNSESGWWHVHAHVVVAVRRHVQGGGGDVDPDDVRTEWGIAWRDSTRQSAADSFGKPDRGWDPLAGVWDRESETADAARGRLAAGDYTGPWWRPIPLSDLRAVHEATKYPTPVASLDNDRDGPEAIAEFIAATSGRRWHEGGWAWRSIRRDAQALLGDELMGDEEREDRDLGIAVGSPLGAPSVDEIRAGWAAHRKAPPTAVEAQAGVAPIRRHGLAAADADLGIPPPDGARVSWVLLPGREDVAREWEARGMGHLGWLERRRWVPCSPLEEGALPHSVAHPSGSVHVRWQRDVVEWLPTFTMPAEHASAILIETEALLLQQG